MNKLNLNFTPGGPARSSDMNSMSRKIDELVDSDNNKPKILIGAGLYATDNLGSSVINLSPGINTILLASISSNNRTFSKVVTDLYGRVISGSNPTTLSGYGITDAKLNSNGEINLGGITLQLAKQSEVDNIKLTLDNKQDKLSEALLKRLQLNISLNGNILTVGTKSVTVNSLSSDISTAVTSDSSNILYTTGTNNTNFSVKDALDLLIEVSDDGERLVPKVSESSSFLMLTRNLYEALTSDLKNNGTWYAIVNDNEEAESYDI